MGRFGNKVNMTRVWLLWNDAPVGGMKALLIFFDVEGPVAIEVPAQIDSSELDDDLGHLLSPTHSRTLHPILDEVLAGALDGATGDGPAVGKVLVVTHASAIAV